jgi:carboxypeptidase Taq
MAAARAQLPGLEDDFARGQFGRLKAWLNAHVHRPGRSYRAGELCRRVTGEGLRHEPLTAYLREKYGRLYGL